jgi:hypothetical protein
MRPRISLSVLTIIILISARAAVAQKVTRAFLTDENHKVHVEADGKEITYTLHEEEVGFGDLAIASDHRTVGWTVMVGNCCTSYPVPASLVLYRGNKKTVISPGQMIWEWRFAGGSERVAILSGPVHGSAARAQLYEAGTGKLLRTWEGRRDAPAWAEQWKDRFKP